MTKEEILNQCSWDSYDMGTLTVYSDFFKKDVEVRLMPDYDDGRTVTNKMVDCLNDFLKLSVEHQPKIEQLLYVHCQMCFENTSYGHVQPQENETETEATKRTFGIYNQEDAYRQANIDSVAINGEHDQYHNRYVEVLFYPTWEDGHGCNIILQNGKPIDWQESVPYIGKYEEK